MLMADESSNLWSFDNLSAGDDGFDELSIDLDSLWDILGESPDPLQNRTDDLPLKNAPQGDSASHIGGLLDQEGVSSLGVELLVSSCRSEDSDSRTGVSDSSSESAGNYVSFDNAKLDPSAWNDSSVHGYSVSHLDGKVLVLGHDSLCSDRDRVSQTASSYNQDDSKETQYMIPNCSSRFSFAAGGANHVSDIRHTSDFDYPKHGTEYHLRCSEENTHSEYLSHNRLVKKSDNSHAAHYPAENSLKNSAAHQIGETPVMDVNTSSYDVSHTQSSFCEFPDILCETGAQYYMNTDYSSYLGSSRQYIPGSFDLPSLSYNHEMMINIKDEGREFLSQNGCLDVAMSFEAEVGREGKAVSESSMTGNPDVKGPNANCEVSNCISPLSGNTFDETYDRLTADKASTQPIPRYLLNMSSKKQVVRVKDEESDELVVLQGRGSQSFEVVSDSATRMPSGVIDGQSLSGILASISSKNHVVHAKDEKEDVFLVSKRARHSVDTFDGTACRNLTPIADNCCLSTRALEQPSFQPSISIGKQLNCIKEERGSRLIQPKSTGSHFSEVSPQSSQGNSVSHTSYADDDSDICILEDLTEPACRNLSLPNGKSLVTSQRSAFNDPLNHMGVGGVRLKMNDERFIFQVALQDLSQSKSEATPPDGVLAVPLLRHQRIALSWMVQKETATFPCSGGILADDQGLGKTVSTIALILKERPPSSKVCKIDMKQNQMETLNLDEDDGVSELDGSKQDAESCKVIVNGSSAMGSSTPVQSRGRPAAGTLVVCPTSVLWQWSEELHNKVTSEANLSVLVYHGSNRTKDPLELAKYDVVLTTYSIVSMEVPKQPLADEDDDDRGKRSHVPSMGLSSSMKTKYPPSSGKISLKGKKGMESDLLESVARPLARVGWFRVVLDEAQSIKNHRTQVARACWGLRAKRRWCLSGTPIQNAVDDLYSYFRFLRYDPYAAYKSFCSTIKIPIHKNRTNGYRKLQAVLKTIMLRRTKGTLLDGEPIITLPPKTVELKKVDFTKEERDFYCRLEADSRAQFAEYAAAGTVKQNYVNILSMLLRLRQACDHPLLVRGYNSNSVRRSSVEMAKKLPWEKQVCLLNCLEASLAICSICNDPPEDAVVSSCGHVFCNQCICEHLTGDDNKCPATNCKAHLSVSLVFSKATLRNSLSNQPGQESTSDSSGSELAGMLDPCSLDCSFDSSKIKAALEVLLSLSKPQDCAPRTSSLESVDRSGNFLEKSSDILSGGIHRDMHDNRNLYLDRSPNNLVSVVGEKAIVFSQWTRMLDLLEACLKNSSIQYRRLDGTMSVVARDKAVKDFNTHPEVSVMIMSLKAASLGLNMVAACHVLLLDLWWNPTTEDQAIDRAHRIGQTRPVTVLRLTVKDTVEDRILALQKKKREMVASAFGEDEASGHQTRLTVEDLQYLFMAE